MLSPKLFHFIVWTEFSFTQEVGNPPPARVIRNMSLNGSEKTIVRIHLFSKGHKNDIVSHDMVDHKIVDSGLHALCPVHVIIAHVVDDRKLEGFQSE